MELTTAPTPILPATAPAVPSGRSALVAAIGGWIVPGFGQLYMGRPFKALLMLVAIGGLFYVGLALTGFTCVNPSTYALEFAAHSFLGGPTAVAYALTQGISLGDALPWFEVGRLYAAVAGLLNVVAICDALGDVIEHNRGVRVQASLRDRWLAAREAERDQALAEAARRQDEFAALAANLAPPGLATTGLATTSPAADETDHAGPAPSPRLREDLPDLPAFLDDDLHGDGTDPEGTPL